MEQGIIKTVSKWFRTGILLSCLFYRITPAAVVDLTNVADGADTANAKDTDVHIGTITFDKGGTLPFSDLLSITLTALDSPSISESSNLSNIRAFYDEQNTPSTTDAAYGAATTFSSDTDGTATFTATVNIKKPNYVHIFCDVGSAIEHEGNLKVKVSFTATNEGTGDPDSNGIGVTFVGDTLSPDNDMTLTATVHATNDSIALSWNPGQVDSADRESVVVWYKTGGFPIINDPGATRLGHTFTDSTDTITSLANNTNYYFTLAVRDTAGNWSDSVTAFVSTDTFPPDNDMTLTAIRGANKNVNLSWNPGQIDSSDADSVGIWYKVGAFPDSANDPSATRLSGYDFTDSVDIVTGLTPDSTYYFILLVRDTNGNWADTIGTASDTAIPTDTIPPDNDMTLTASQEKNKDTRKGVYSI